MTQLRQVTLSLLACAAMLISMLAVYLNAQTSYPPPNEGLPNPYRAIPNWAKLPDGRSWGATAGVAVAPNSNVWAVDRCGSNKNGCRGSRLDQSSSLIKPESPEALRRGLFESPHGIFVDKDGNVWVTEGAVSDDKKIGYRPLNSVPTARF